MIYPHLMETTRKTYILVHLLAELHWQPISSNGFVPLPFHQTWPAGNPQYLPINLLLNGNIIQWNMFNPAMFDDQRVLFSPASLISWIVLLLSSYEHS